MESNVEIRWEVWFSTPFLGLSDCREFDNEEELLVFLKDLPEGIRPYCVIKITEETMTDKYRKYIPE